MAQSDPAGMPDEQRTRWFVEEVQCHGLALRSYLRGTFPTIHDAEDVVQESFLRIWKARAAHPIQSTRAFLFRVARNVALDRVRKNASTPVDAVGDLAALNVVDERADAVDPVGRRERLALLADALASLPPRSREVVILCKLQGYSYREVAVRLGISEKTVTEHVYRGAQRLGEALKQRGLDRFAP